MITVRPTTAKDVAVWRDLRRDGIERFPSAFIPTLEEHDATPKALDAERLDQGNRFLAFDGKSAVGLCGLNRQSMPRAAHRAEIGPLYVAPDAQGSGVATALVGAALDHARTLGIWQIELAVNEDNAAAIALYERLGFHKVGRIPNAILGADGPEHDLLYVLYLPPA